MKIKGNVGGMVKISGKIIRIISDTEGTRYEIRTIEKNSSSHIITLDEEYVDFPEEEAEPAPVDLASIAQKIGEGERIKRKLAVECNNCAWFEKVKPDEDPCRNCYGQLFKAKEQEATPGYGYCDSCVYLEERIGGLELPERCRTCLGGSNHELKDEAVQSGLCMACKHQQKHEWEEPCHSCNGGTNYEKKPKRGRPRKATVEDLTAKAEKIRKKGAEHGKNDDR